MRDETGTRFIDWIDHIRLNRSDRRVAQLEKVGYRAASEHISYTVYVNPSGVFPAVLAWDGGTEIGIKVESVADFLSANQLERDILGSPLAVLRTCRVYTAQDRALTIVERHGTRDFDAGAPEPENMVRRLVHSERFRTRPRTFKNDQGGFEAANRLIDDAIRDADIVMMLRIQTEREKNNIFPSLREYANHFSLNSRNIALAREDALIMHPGPMNRGIEISPDIADGPRSIILDQVTNGVAVRMALLYLLTGGDE